MLRGQLTTLLGLLSGVWLPTGSGRPGTPSTPAQAGTAANQSWTLDPLVPASALGSWKTFLGLQDRQQGAGGLQGGQREAAAVSLPLLPQEVLQETCKTVAFIQVLSRPGCTAARVLNRLCFGHCSSFYIPSAGPTPAVLCNSCVPAQKRQTSAVLWCGAGHTASRRPVRMPITLVQKCQCRPKL
ncbi:LOW QUALITY PROTEIN: DAN domain family member 5 [Mesocricetus auratus]|uniref:LOW QUALITY PROTEIN: DAN domain family member 5 n=1 Tax=Mesocricetus auratus TaxID=10036 RepID=A0A1U7R4I1_MESAU|nr:LOW QUALITY PROTEIN: DAN domain family member 5 [Mesocricetus auratus]